MYGFSVDFGAIKKSDISNIPKYLMVKNDVKQCLDLLKKFIGLLTASTTKTFDGSLASNSKEHVKCVPLNNW